MNTQNSHASNGTTPSRPLTAPARLRALLAASKSHPITAPGVFDGLSTRIALEANFPALYMTGAGTSLSALGLPDIGLASLPEMVHTARLITGLATPAVPLIADADTGYGGPVAVARTVREYARAGVAGVQLEDQVQSKRCGHLAGKQVVAREEWRSRVRAAVQSREVYVAETGGSPDDGIVIVARSDAAAAGCGGIEEMLERLRIAVEEGADVVFPEALTTTEECRMVVKYFSAGGKGACGSEAGVPVLLNMVAKGRTPWFTVEEAKEAGFRIVIFPVVGVEAAVKGMREAMSLLKEKGTADVEASVGVHGLFGLCGLDKCTEIDRKAGGKSFANV